MNTKTWRRAAATVLAVAAIGLAGQSAIASPPSDPPGQGECNHGNSQASCRPDPQPSHGADCDEHGPNDGGVNEDHCASPTPEVTPSQTPSIDPSPSVAPSATPSEDPSPTPTSTSTPTESPTVTPTGTPTETTTPTRPAPTPPNTATEDEPTTPRTNPALLLIAAIFAAATASFLLAPERTRRR